MPSTERPNLGEGSASAGLQTVKRSVQVGELWEGQFTGVRQEWAFCLPCPGAVSAGAGSGFGLKIQGISLSLCR